MRVINFILFSLIFVSLSFPQEIRKIEEKVEVYLVLVPTVVFDKKGNFVEGLQKEDFEIFENGEKQDISTFYLQKFSKEGIQIEGVKGREKKLENILGQRTIVIIFDQMISSPFHVTRVKEPMENFVKKFLRKEDTVLFIIGGKSYFWWGGQFFSNSLDPVGEMIKKAMLGYFYPLDFKGVKIESESFELEERKDNLYGLSLRQRKGFLPYLYEMISFQGLQRLKAIAEGLKKIEGEKIVILLSEGYGSFVSSSSKYRELQDASYMAKFFNDSNCKVYSIDIGGLRDKNFDTTQFVPAYTKDIQVGAQSSMLLSSFEQIFLRELSHETGGKAITNTNDMKEGLEFIGDMISMNYILGYTPKNRALDGKYRKIGIKVKRKGVEVRHRKGYFATDWREEQFIELQQLLEKGKKEKTKGKSLSISIEEEIISTSDGNFVYLSIEPENLALSTLFQEEKERWNKIFTSRFLVLAEILKDGKTIKKAKDEIYFVLERESLKNKPFVLWANPLAEGKYRIRVAIEDKNSGLMEMEEKEIYVPSNKMEEEGIDRLFFVNESELIRSIGEERFFPEINGRRLYPKSPREFRRDEMLSIYFEYLNKNSGEAFLNCNIFKDEKLIKTKREKIEIKSKKTPVYLSIPLSEMEEGEYLLEVKVTHKGKEFSKGRIFRVIS